MNRDRKLYKSIGEVSKEISISSSIEVAPVEILNLEIDH